MAFETILEHLPIGYAQLDQEYKFIYANTSFCQLVGYQPEEIVGRLFFDISHPAEHAADFEAFQKLKSGEINTTRQEKRFIHKKGEIISGEVVCAPGLPATDSFTLAISFTIQAKSKEEEQSGIGGHESFSYLFMNNPQAMIIYSTETLKVLNANDAAIEFTGYSREDLKGFDLKNLFSEESWKKVTEFMLANTEMFRKPQEWPIYTKAGEKRIVESVSHLIRYQGREARHVMITDITDRKKTEGRLRNQKEFINQSQVLAKMGSWDFDIERNVTRWSDNLYRLMGVDKTETKLSFEYFMGLVHPDDQWIISDAYERILKEQKEVELELRIVLPDQRLIWIQNNILPEFEDGKLVMLKGVNIDITERKLSELHLNQHIQLENILFEISQDFINANSSTVDHLIHHALEKIGQFTQTDRAYVFQFNRQMTLMDNTHEWCKDGITPQIENLQGLSPDIFPWWMQRMKERGIINFQDISELPAEASQEKEILQAQDIISILVLPLFFEGQLKGFVGFDTVSVKKKWEDHDINNLRSLTDLISNVLAHRNREEELVRSKERAEESLRLKSAFLSTISHELRTPLNPIIGFSDMLPEMTQDTRILEIANFINQSGIEMIHLLEDLFDLSLAQGHRILPNPTKVNCADFYTIAWAILEEILVKAGKFGAISITYLDSGLGIFHEMEIDQGKALQVLVALFKNAVKFTEQGEIEFAFRIEPDGSGIEMAVRDTGVGFDAAKEAIIFDEFRQVDESLSRNFGGLGIGLAIAKRLITIMGGEIHANSVVGRGSTFTVSLPVPVSCNTKRYESTLFDASDVDLLRGKTFLVVDDNRFIAEIIAVQLQAFDLRLEFASNGKEALEYIQKAVPDLVLMDLYMPVMDGIEATRQIRLTHPDLPIVAMTAHSWPKEHYRSLNAGCNDLITKPIYREILLHKIRQLL